ncbi:TPA: hypothetical protein L1342_002713, partial [Escherichia coli]|nr:hypothetical protein [Escherichia coli]
MAMNGVGCRASA